MKLSYRLTIVLFVAVFLASCSRQLTNLGTSSRLLAVSAPANTVTPVVIGEHNAQPMKPEGEAATTSLISDKKTDYKHVAKSSHPTFSILKEQSLKIIQKAIVQAASVEMGQKHVMEHDYPQINKAGFILILAGILALIFHLIIYAWIALIVLGLIILLSPLFRRRY